MIQICQRQDGHGILICAQAFIDPVPRHLCPDCQQSADLTRECQRLGLGDWPRDFDGTLRRLLAFLDLPYDPACAKFHEVEREVQTVSRSQVREPVHGRGLGRWRGYSAQLAPLIEALREAGASLPD